MVPEGGERCWSLPVEVDDDDEDGGEEDVVVDDGEVVEEDDDDAGDALEGRASTTSSCLGARYRKVWSVGERAR